MMPIPKIVLAALAIALQAAPSFAQAKLVPIDPTPRIAVMSAFEPEWLGLKAAVENAQTVAVNGNSFVTGQLEGQDVVLFLSGVSMVNAAMTTQLALDHFEVEAIVFSGIAGGVDPELSIGDVVVAEQWGAYLEAVFARKTAEGWDLPSYATKSFPNYGMIFPQEVGVVSARGAAIEKRFWFPADPEMLDLARRIAGTVALERCNAAKACLDRQPKVVVGGNGVSGMAFVDNAEFRKYAFETFDAEVLEMETAAVAHVAYANQVPFIAFRSLSDLAGGGDGENEMETFFSLASENSARVVRAFLGALAKEPRRPSAQ